jgi:hypothetical protein
VPLGLQAPSRPQMLPPSTQRRPIHAATWSPAAAASAQAGRSRPPLSGAPATEEQLADPAASSAASLSSSCKRWYAESAGIPNRAWIEAEIWRPGPHWHGTARKGRRGGRGGGLHGAALPHLILPQVSRSAMLSRQHLQDQCAAARRPPAFLPHFKAALEGAWLCQWLTVPHPLCHNWITDMKATQLPSYPGGAASLLAFHQSVAPQCTSLHISQDQQDRQPQVERLPRGQREARAAEGRGWSPKLPPHASHAGPPASCPPALPSSGSYHHHHHPS